MKKILLLLTSAFITFNAFGANNTKEICHGGSVTFSTSKQGDKYEWFKNDQLVKTYTTNQAFTDNNVTADATYKCKVTTNGSTTDTGNLITEGSFAKSCSNTVNYNTVKNSQNNEVRYQLMNFSCTVDDYTSPGFTTVVRNSTDAKPNFFAPLTTASNKGDYFLVCDGASSSGVRIWEARDISLKAGITYQFSCMVANVDKNSTTNGASSLSNLEFRIEYDGNYGDGELLMAFQAPSQPGVWVAKSTTFTPTRDYQYCHIHIRNHNVLSAGNDFALDDIYFGTVVTTGPSFEEETFEVKVYEKPILTITSPAPVCPGENATITSSIASEHGGKLDKNITYTWTDNSNSTVGSNKDLTIAAPNTVSSATYKLTAKGSLCPSDQKEGKITAKDCEETKTINHPEQTNCPEQNVTLNVSTDISDAISVVWDHEPTNSTKQSTVKAPASPNVPPVPYKCTITKNENGSTVIYIENFSVKAEECTSTETINHTLNNCPGQEVELVCTSTNNIDNANIINNIVWSHNSSIEGSKTKVKTNTIANKIDEYTCNITITKNGETTVYTEIFKVKSDECTDDNQEKENLLIGSSITLKSQYLNTPGATYKWYKVEPDGTRTLIGTDDRIDVVADSDATYESITTLPNGYVVTETRIIEIYTMPELKPMIFFTPNNDALNDLWLIEGIEGAPDAFVMIYDRNSKLLYKCKGEDFTGWDGKYNEKDMIQDDYWYVITIPESNKTLSGHFTLKR